jgi:hypothetical protein
VTISTNPTTEECRDIECTIAEKLLGYRRVSVGKDYEGKNEGEVLVPPTWGKGGGYTYPPRGPIALWHHVPRWASDEQANWRLIEWMKARGSSLTLNWGEDNNLWEVSWISSGNRLCGFHTDLKLAVCICALAAAEKISSE